MGKRENNFKEFVHKKYGEFKHPKISRIEIENSKYIKNVTEVYKKLNGQYLELPIGYGSWDISTKNFIIEIDEERHFNRYRKQTLESPFYKSSKLFPLENYNGYCDKFELNCIKSASWGGNWKNISTEKMFEKSNVDGNLNNSGSSRWKQRAYYDFLKDVTSEILKIPVIRISIYDLHKGLSVNQLLEENNLKYLDELLKHHLERHSQ